MASQSPEKKSAFRSRMGTVMRRTSSIVTLGALGGQQTQHDSTPAKLFGRRGSVASNSASDSSDSKRPSIDIAPTQSPSPPREPSQSQNHSVNPSTVPSPIAESPAREAAASLEDATDAANPAHIHVASPLVNQIAPTTTGDVGPVTTSQEEDVKKEADAHKEPEYTAEDPTHVHQTSILVDGHTSFVAEPESMSQYSKEQNGHATVQAPEPDFTDAAPIDTTIVIPPSTEPETARSLELKTSVEEPTYFDIKEPPRVESFEPPESREESLHEAIHRNTMRSTGEVEVEEQTTPRPHGSTADAENANEQEQEQEQEQKIPSPQVIVVNPPMPQVASQVEAPVPATAVVVNPMPEPHVHQEPERHQPSMPVPIPIPVVYTDERWEQELEQQQTKNSITESDENPFADRHGVPEVTVVQYPLPAPLKGTPSMATLTDAGGEFEHQRLLGPPPPPPTGHGGYDAAPQHHPGQSHHSHHFPQYTDSISTAEYSNPNPTPRPQPHLTYIPGQRVTHLGFIEFPLPDGGVYYIHATRRVVVDGDLRRDGRADGVVKYLDRGFDSMVWNHRTRAVEPGWELWLRERVKTKAIVKGKKKKGSVKRKGKGREEEEEVEYVRYWVDHKTRRVFVDPDVVDGEEERRVNVDDVLDAEYRFWSYLEDHPAHISLPANARKDAMDVLNWTWSDLMLKPSSARTAPFSQEECQHLLGHLNSFGDMGSDPSNSGIQSFVHTRVVAQVHLRYTEWRQAAFRPQKPFPQDIQATKRHPVRRPAPTPRLSVWKRLLDFVLSIFFLGVPYIFMNRAHADEEGGGYGGRGWSAAVPMMIVGACTCIVAATILSASITFLSLPDINNIASLVGVISALLSTVSMVSTVVAVWKYKNDLEREMFGTGEMGMAYSGYGHGYGTFAAGGVGEGMMVHSKRIMILSLPLTLLIYAIITFVSAVVLYSFFNEGGMGIQRHFASYMTGTSRWGIVLVGGLVGVVATAVLMLRR